MGSACERRSHTTRSRLEHGAIKPQSSRCLRLWMCVSRNHASGIVAVFVVALHASGEPELAAELAAAGRQLSKTPINACSLSLCLTLLLLCNLHKKTQPG